MKLSALTIVGVLLSIQVLFAQKESARLMLQSPNGKTVKLIWFVDSGTAEMTGFDIKRKAGLADWVKLNAEPIVPGISMKRSFQAQGATKAEESILKAKLFKLLSSRKLNETDEQYFSRLLSDREALLKLNEILSADYDVAMMHGFAFLDHSISNKTDYQYGLFVAGTNLMLAKAVWNYGEIPDLNTITEITSRSAVGKSGVEVIWNADAAKMATGYVAGFNIYRQGIPLNSSLITRSKKDTTEFSWYDKSANSAIPIQYSISAQSVFGVEGIIKSYTYEPADHPTQYNKAEVTEINSLGYYFKDGININWKFPKEKERFIKGFYIEKDNMPNGYKHVSSLLAPDTRSFVDVTPSPPSVYLRFRVLTVYNDRTMERGVERLYSYFPISEPPRPQNLTAELPATNNKVIIALRWAGRIAGDSATDHYVVYANEQGSDKYSAVTEGTQLKGNKYTYRVPDGIARGYKFYVTAVNRVSIESVTSDTIAVQVPTTALPAPVIFRATAETNSVLLQWQYPEVIDLKGFTLIQNDKVIATEKELHKNTRQFQVNAEKGTNTFVLRALCDNGVISENSAPVSVVMPEGTN